jgi:hypothetical protein
LARIGCTSRAKSTDFVGGESPTAALSTTATNNIAVHNFMRVSISAVSPADER